MATQVKFITDSNAQECLVFPCGKFIAWAGEQSPAAYRVKTDGRSYHNIPKRIFAEAFYDAANAPFFVKPKFIFSAERNTYFSLAAIAFGLDAGTDEYCDMVMRHAHATGSQHGVRRPENNQAYRD